MYMIHNDVNQDLDTENLLIANSIYPTLKNEHFIWIMKSMLYIGPNKTNRQKNILKIRHTNLHTENG